MMAQRNLNLDLFFSLLYDAFQQHGTEPPGPKSDCSGCASCWLEKAREIRITERHSSNCSLRGIPWQKRVLCSRRSVQEPLTMCRTSRALGSRNNIQDLSILCRAVPQARSLHMIGRLLLSAIHFWRYLILESSSVVLIATARKVKSPSWEGSVLLWSKLRSSAVPCSWYWLQIVVKDPTILDAHATVLCIIAIVVMDHSHALLLKDTAYRDMKGMWQSWIHANGIKQLSRYHCVIQAR